MRHVVVRYRIKPERVAENERLIAAVFEELARTAPSNLRYASFKLADGVSFMHVASVDTSGPHPLTSLATFQAFTRAIAERCDEPPVTSELTAIGRYP